MEELNGNKIDGKINVLSKTPSLNSQEFPGFLASKRTIQDIFSKSSEIKHTLTNRILHLIYLESDTFAHSLIFMGVFQSKSFSAQVIYNINLGLHQGVGVNKSLTVALSVSQPTE